MNPAPGNRSGKLSLLICGLSCRLALSAIAQSPADYAVRVSAVVQGAPPAVTLSWPAESAASGFTVYRKGRDDTAWGSVVAALPGQATGYTDTNVLIGKTYEYGIVKTASGYSGYGYIYTGIQAPLVESRGKVVLVVDNTFSSSLAKELARLQQDLVGDGWIVLRHDVPRMSVDPANSDPDVGFARSNELAAVKALIRADYAADPTNVNTVFLFGHVPVPYSESIVPDEHAQHEGAWPADAYYGDMNGTWTDSRVTDTKGVDPRNWNVPGDGKFDQISHNDTMTNVTLCVGRVDLANLPAFPQPECELLRGYLDKDHNFRNKVFSVEERGLIDDQFGVYNGAEPFAVAGWRNFSAFFGVSNILSGDWLSTLTSQGCLWGYGCGPGSSDYTTSSGVASTWALVTNDTQVVFTMLFGSYFGDWDSPNNLMRSQLATATYTLSCAWSGRPNWQFHHMALGETIGFSARSTQNNGTLYDPGMFPQCFHIALMGDPTLRMHMVAPPSGLTVAGNSAGGIDLHWASSPDPVAGYCVYQAPTIAGPFANLTGGLIAGTAYTVAAPGSDACVYMVRAVNLEVSASGSYFNASEGIFGSLADNQGSPRLAVALAGGGGVAITGGDALGRIYTIQCVDDLSLTNWQTLGVATNSPTGFQFIDALAPPRRFYRSVCQ
jgi:hypothetical protein